MGCKTIYRNVAVTLQYSPASGLTGASRGKVYETNYKKNSTEKETTLYRKHMAPHTKETEHKGEHGEGERGGVARKQTE